jgi:hypothetical protein
VTETKGGYEADLRQAESEIEALAESSALKTAFRRHAEAQRNMMQGALVPMFVEMVERSMGRALAPLIVSDKDKIARLERIEVALEHFHHDVLGDVLSRQARLENVAFLELLKAEHPDLAAEAKRRATEAGGAT